MADYDHHTIIVTGAGSGIGRQVAIQYASLGASVAIWDRDEKGLHETLQMLDTDRKSSHLVDLTQPEQIVNAVEEVYKTFGRIDLLINNAGLGKPGSPYDLLLEDWDYVINTNLRGTFLCAREAARYMKKQGKGAIVNIASTRALMSEPNTEAYAASKGGILALTHALAISLGPDKINVNAISPGWIQTTDYEQLSETDHKQHPAGRVGKPEDIAKACIYLTDPDNDFITGANFVIDGGMTRKMIYEE